MNGRLLPLPICLLLMSTASASGQEFTTASAQTAVDRYLAEIEEIDRVAAHRKAEAKERLR